MALYDLQRNRAIEGFASLGKALMVAPPTGNFGVETIGVIPANTNWYSQAYDTIVPRARIGVVAMVYDASDTPKTNEEIEVEWAAVPEGPWVPAPTSATGDARQSLVVATGSDRSLISRGQPMNRYFRVRFKSAGSPTLATRMLYLNWGNIF